MLYTEVWNHLQFARRADLSLKCSQVFLYHRSTLVGALEIQDKFDSRATCLEHCIYCENIILLSNHNPLFIHWSVAAFPVLNGWLHIFTQFNTKAIYVPRTSSPKDPISSMSVSGKCLRDRSATAKRNALLVTTLVSDLISSTRAWNVSPLIRSPTRFGNLPPTSKSSNFGSGGDDLPGQNLYWSPGIIIPLASFSLVWKSLRPRSRGRAWNGPPGARTCSLVILSSALPGPLSAIPHFGLRATLVYRHQDRRFSGLRKIPPLQCRLVQSTDQPCQEVDHKLYNSQRVPCGQANLLTFVFRRCSLTCTLCCLQIARLLAGVLIQLYPLCVRWKSSRPILLLCWRHLLRQSFHRLLLG